MCLSLSFSLLIWNNEMIGGWNVGLAEEELLGDSLYYSVGVFMNKSLTNLLIQSFFYCLVIVRLYFD